MAKVKAVAITTYDNPYDPIDDYSHWFIFDESSGYHTTSYLGRLLSNSDALTTDEERIEIERAIDEMIRYDFQNIYKKVEREIEEELIAE